MQADTEREQQQTLDQFIAAYGITMTAERCDQNPHMADSHDMDHWKVTFRRDDGRRHRMTTYFSMGFAHKGAEPKPADVLDCLASDYTQESFQDWCRDLGFDTDSRKAERTYKAVQIQTQRLKLFLGADAFEVLVYQTERL